jgi:hypothetical protein
MAMTNIQSPQKLPGYTKEINQLFFRKLILLNLFSMSWTRNEEVPELFEVLKVLTQGQDHLSHSVVIPHKFLADMKIIKGDYLKIHMEENRIWMEKLTQ